MPIGEFDPRFLKSNNASLFLMIWMQGGNWVG